jgi:hypothetical protein
VTPFPGADGAPLPHSKQRPKDSRAAARQARKRSKNKAHRDTSRGGADARAPSVAHLDAPPIATEDAPSAIVEERVCSYPVDPPRARDLPWLPQPDAGGARSNVQAIGNGVHLPSGSAHMRPREAHAQRHGRGIRFAALVAALGLATVSGGFSITGMTSIFVGAYWPVIGMGVALEAGKLAAVAWLGHHWSTAPKLLRRSLGALVVILMGLNAIGCYGFLAKAHIGHQVEGETAVAGKAADADARIAVQAAVVADLSKQIADLDTARTIEAPPAGNLRTASAINAQAAAVAAAAKLRVADDERRQAKRTSLADKLTTEAKTLAELRVDKAKIDGERKIADADLGPVRYLAMLLGADSETTLRWFVLIVAVLLDPSAVLLLLAATRR